MSVSMEGKQEEEKHFIPDLLETLELNQSDPNQINGLQTFCKKAKAYAARKHSHDVVEEFLKYPSSCFKLSNMLSTANISAEKVTWIFNTMHNILLRINGDLAQFENVVQDTVHHLVQYELTTFCSLLEKGQQYQGTKAALQLLTSIVMLSPQHAKMLAAQFTILSDNLYRLASMRKFEDASDIRTCLAHFIMSFLIMDISSVVRQICEHQGILNAIIIGLPYDKASLIQPFLMTMKSKVLENPCVSKTQKIRILNEQSLMSIFSLLSWKGPKTLENKKLLRKVTEDKEAWILQDASKDEVELVQTVAFEFLKVACTSKKLGIILSEDQFQQGRNPNFSIFKVLLSQQQLFDDQRKRELVAEILHVCPNQMHYFLSNIKSSFEPRNSIMWLNSMTFITRVASLQNLESILSESSPQQDIFPVVKKIQTSLGMFVLQKKHIFSALRSTDMFLMLVMTEWLNVALGKIQSILILQDKYPDWNIRSICNELLRFLPSLSDILPIFLEEGNFKETFAQCKLPEGVKLTMVDYLNKMTDLLVLCCELGSSNLETELPGAFPRLLSFIKVHESALDEADILLMHLKVLKLISPDLSTIHLWQGKVVDECSPLFMLFDLYIRITELEASNNTKRLISQLFSSFEDFEGYEWEIEIWLEELRALTLKKRRKALKLFCHIVQAFLCNPNQYIDNVLECRLEALGRGVPDETVNNNVSNEEFLDTLEKQLILNSELHSRTFGSFFTPLVPASLTSVSEHSKLAEDCKSFLEKVFLKILHKQHEPEALCIVLQRARDVLSPFLWNYTHFWHKSESASKETFKSVQAFWQSYIDEFTSLHRKQPGNLQLLTAFILFHLKPETQKDPLYNVSLAISKAAPTSNHETKELLSQSLLYLQSQLKSIPGDDNANNVSVICTYIDKLILCLCDSLHSDADKFELVRETITHPVFKKWFIIPEDWEPTSLISENVHKCNHLLTDLTSKYLGLASQLEPDMKKLEAKIGVFKSKLLATFNVISLSKSKNVQGLWDNINQGVIGCLGLFTASDVAHLLNSLLSMPITRLKLVSNVYELIQILMERFLEFDNKYETMYLKTSTVVTLFELVCGELEDGTGDGREKLLNCLLAFVEQHPMYCIVASPACFDYLLVECGSVSLPLVRLLCKYNQSLRLRLHKWLKNNVSCVILWPPFLCLQMLEDVYTLHHSKLDDEQFLERLSKIYLQHLSTVMTNWESEEESEDGLSSFFLLNILLERGEVEKSSLIMVMEQTLKQSLACQVVPSMNTIFLINQVFECFDKCCPSFKIGNLAPKSCLVMMHLHWIIVLLNKQESSDPFLLDFASETFSLIQNTKKNEIMDGVLEFNSWHQFVLSLLRKALRCNITGPVLISILKELSQVMLCDVQMTISPSAPELLQLILTHSSFGTIMLEVDSALNMLKEPVINLWTSLVSLTSSCCQSEHFPILLGSYRATLSHTDQKLFNLMSIYEESGISMHGFRPFVWGPSAMSYYTSQAKSRLSLWKQPKLEDISHLLDKEKLYKTCINGPLDLKLKTTQKLFSANSTESKVEENIDGLSSLYDARFLLLVLNHLVQLGSVVDCEKFVSSHCLAFVLSTLSYQDQDLRALGYQVLSLFYQHLEGRFSHYNKTWVFILNALRNALKTPNVRLSSLITNFLGKATTVLSKPNDHLYTVIYKFLALKPVLDTGNVPEFYELFYSSDIHHIQHRTFLLSLLQEGMRTSLDFHLSQKRFVFPIILSYCTSTLCRPQTKVLILDTLLSAVRIHSVALILCRTQSLIAWVQSFIANHIPEMHKEKIVSCIVKVLGTLWQTSKAEKITKSQSKDKISMVAKIEDSIVDVDNDEDGNERDISDEDSGSDVEMTAPTDTVTNRSSESVDLKSVFNRDAKKTIHPFYSSFPNEFLLVCLSLLDVVREHQDISMLNRCLTICFQSFKSLPNSRPFLIYLTEDHLDFLLRCANLSSRSEPVEEICKISTHSLLKSCHHNAVQLLMLVPPKTYISSHRFNSVLETLTSFLESALTDFTFVNSFCLWLFACLKHSTEREEFVKCLVQQGNDGGNKCVALLLASLTECVLEVAGSATNGSALDCLHSLVMLFLTFISEKHKELAEACSKISTSLDNQPNPVSIDVKKIIKLGMLCQEILLHDHVSEKTFRKMSASKLFVNK